MAFDAEWYESGGENIVISYQIATVSRFSGKNIIEYMAPGERLTLEEIVELGITSVNDGQIPESHIDRGTLVILISHHVTAEWSVLADRKEPYITENLAVIRKSPVTGTRPIRRDIQDCTVDIKICDTRLTAPVDYQSLSKLSTLLGSENDLKISIEHYFKKRMNIFQRERPEEFEAYALQDSLVTLKLFFLLQRNLMELAFGADLVVTTVTAGHGILYVPDACDTTGNGSETIVLTGSVDEVNKALSRMEYEPYNSYVGPDTVTVATEDQGDTGRPSSYIETRSIEIKRKWIKNRKPGEPLPVPVSTRIKKTKIFSTLASAAVAGYIVKHANFRAYQRLLRSRHFADAFKIVKRAYHGGRNEGYLVGHSESDEVTSNRVWVDIDFVGCYPTAMALCPQIKCGVDLSGQKLSPTNIESLVENLSVPFTYLPLVYKLPDMTDDKLLKAGIPVAVYRVAKATLDKLDTITDRRDWNAAIREFDRILSDISKPSEKGLSRKQARKIRQMAQVPNNTLIDKWYQTWKTAQSSGDTRPERYIIPGYAHVRFNFKRKTDYPCLPVIHPRYGLIYPQRGECTVPAPEIMLAMEAGAEIKALASLELPVEMNESLPEQERIPKRLFFDHLAWLTKKRMDQKKISIDSTEPEELRQKAQVMERLLKEFLNSFYGKTAQAIRHRKTYHPATGEMKPLVSSPISEPSAAALATGLPRAALSAILLAVEKYNRQKIKGKRLSPDKQIVIVSATTDGLLLGLPRPTGFSLTGEGYYSMTKKGFKLDDDRTKVLPILQRCGCEKLMDYIEEQLPIRQMRNSRKELTAGKNATYLEVKHMADFVRGVKTRGQIGWVRYQPEGEAEARNIVTIQAKFGVKPPLSDIIMEKSTLKGIREKENEYSRVYESGGHERATWEGDWINELIERIESGEEEEICHYNFYSLTGFNEIMKSEQALDLVQKSGRRKKFNADFDWKRKLVKQEGKLLPITIPHEDVTEMLAHRSKMETERRRGRNAQPEKILHLVDLRGRRIRSRGGDQATVVRSFLRGVLHNRIPGATLGRSYSKATDRLNQMWESLGCTFQDSLVVGQDGKTVRKPSSKTTWTRDDFKNAKKDKQPPDLIMPTPKLERLVEELCREFGVLPEKAKREIFSFGDDGESSKALTVQVAQALLQAPRMGLEPYRTLYHHGHLPDEDDIIRVLHPHMSKDLLKACAIDIFRPNMRPPTDRPRLVRIFRRFGMLREDAEGCARIIAQPAPRNTKPRRNPAVTKCMETFVQAVLQPDIAQQHIQKREILTRLKGYGLTESRMRTLSKSKFVPRLLTDTPANRQQINKMAKIMGLDPTAIADAILDR